jgi:uncharacterized repeat protein (TIGR04138 family)
MDKMEPVDLAEHGIDEDAYAFIIAVARMSNKHQTGAEFCENVRKVALNQYGMLAKIVLEHFGWKSTRDIGEFVFKLIGADLFAKTDDDKIEDFDDVFEWNEEAFEYSMEYVEL